LILYITNPGLDDNTGAVIFGGVDSAKYTGSLVALPLQADPQTGKVDAFWVTFAGIEIDGNGGKAVYSAATASPALLDSGTAEIYLPTKIFTDLIAGLGGSDQDGVVPCSLINSQGVLKFRFGNSNGPIIAVPFSEIIENVPAGNFSNGAAACPILIAAAGDLGLIFGDPFLRAAYVVYNIAGNQLAVAQAKLNVTTSSITAITATASIPGVISTATGQAATTISVSSVSSASGTWNLGTATAAAR
jgi:hypothetical protein